MKGNRTKLWLLILLFTVLTSLPFLFKGFGILALFSFVPLFYIDKILSSHKIKGAYWYTLAAFLGFNIGATFWIWNVSIGGAIAAILLNALQMSAIFAVFRWSRKSMKGALPYIFFIAMWTAWEKVYCNIEISWPWLQLGNSFCYDTWMVQWYEYTGLLGGTVWILFTSLLAYYSIEHFRKPVSDKYSLRKRWTLAAGCILAVTVPMICSAVIARNRTETSDPVEVAVIQPDIDPWSKSGSTLQSDYDNKLLSLADSVVSPETRYVVTPETFTYNINIDNIQSNPSVIRYENFLKQHPTVNQMLLGALTYKNYVQKEKPTETARNAGYSWYDVMNSAIMLDSAGRYTYSYKSKLVPGAEIIPYQKYLKFLIPFMEKFGAPSTSYARSHKPKLLLCDDSTSVATLICYESVYSEWVREAVSDGASWLAVITNDGWWGNTPGFRQHFRYATLRAIETRRDVVQSANNGRSGIIDQLGHVRHSTKYWVKDAFLCEVNRNNKQTFYVRNGDLIGRAFTFIFVLMLAGWIIRGFTLCLSRNKRSRKS
ncbi:MAG: apolipoprotein N-acyltransferase [Bacteroidales bacterium]|jgi:apolipoprotein N-acyltransferase|nr:apolipoprotein N-acyltransferase [Bacteroidales bacterium]MCI2121797.1 apolipoprotein N-acyltransferase [Bacteroidales bacterium]MCI2146028.1 apolipoprotein N-acyltransferase [Bacteroidales bacterium]